MLHWWPTLVKKTSYILKKWLRLTMNSTSVGLSLNNLLYREIYKRASQTRSENSWQVWVLEFQKKFTFLGLHCTLNKSIFIRGQYGGVNHTIVLNLQCKYGSNDFFRAEGCLHALLCIFVNKSFLWLPSKIWNELNSNFKNLDDEYTKALHTQFRFFTLSWINKFICKFSQHT